MRSLSASLFLFLFLSFQNAGFAQSGVQCRALFAPQHRAVSDAVEIESREGEALMLSFGFGEGMVAGLSDWAIANQSRVFLRQRNSNALQFEGNPDFHPKDGDIPFKTSPDGLVRAESKEAVLKRGFSGEWAQVAWAKWEAAVLNGKYIIDNDGFVHLRNVYGPRIYSDVDVYAVVSISGAQRPQLIRLGNGKVHINDALEVMALASLNSAASQDQPYNLIRHGSQIEHPMSVTADLEEPLLEVNEFGTLRVVSRDAVSHLVHE